MEEFNEFKSLYKGKINKFPEKYYNDVTNYQKFNRKNNISEIEFENRLKLIVEILDPNCEIIISKESFEIIIYSTGDYALLLNINHLIITILLKEDKIYCTKNCTIYNKDMSYSIIGIEYPIKKIFSSFYDLLNFGLKFYLKKYITNFIQHDYVLK